MTDETAVEAVTTAAANDKPAGDATGDKQTAEGKSFSQADVDRIVKERLQRAQTAAEQQVTKAREEAEAKALAEQGKFKELYEKQQADLQAKEQRIKAMELDAMRRSVATRLGLPEGLHDRLRGETVDDIETDAKTLLASIPRPTAPNINNSMGGAAQPLTVEGLVQQRRQTDNIYVPF